MNLQQFTDDGTNGEAGGGKEGKEEKSYSKAEVQAMMQKEGVCVGSCVFRNVLLFTVGLYSVSHSV